MAKPDFYVANEPLYIGRQRAANPGDQVPVENVERFGWEDLVSPVEDAVVFDLATANIDAILEHVGEDPARAREALDAEQDKGDKARPTLIENLQPLTVV